MNKKVFVIIVTYNGSKWIEKCINSLLHSTYPIDIVVIDNCSTDNSVELLKQFPQIHLIQSKENLGFGKANNIGIDYALQSEADYVFLLNQDTWVFDDTISNLVAVAQNNPSFGIVSPMHFSGDEKTLDEGFVTYYSRKIGESLDKNIVIVPFVNAAAWLVSSACLRKVGGFESLFGHYGEDRNY
ncbi:glycosyltransferase family 2 protein, partial [Flavobacterium sp.]|uniref:glycosyltransferase family 2 protein n=1 Tax=Flavobacterium sp. TaxID=239 RepID=UPI0038FC5331